jgi:phosphonate transport system substrate-binding protein
MRILLPVFLFFISASHAQPLTVATYQYATNNRIANIQPLADQLGVVLKRAVQVKSYASVHAFIEGIRNNEADIVLINTFGYLLLEAGNQKHEMKAAAVLSVKQGASDNYKTAFIAPVNYPADNLQQAAGIAPSTRLLLVSPGSTSGNLVPRLALSGAGIKEPEQKFQSVTYAGNHRNAIDSITQTTQSVIAAIGSTEYFSGLKDPARAGLFKLLWLSPEIPLGPVLVHNRLSVTEQEKIQSLLLSLHTEHPQALESVKKGWSEAAQAEKYIPFTSNYYQAFVSQMGDPQTLEKILKQFAN